MFMYIHGTSGLKWVAVARHGLKLWENEATRLRILFVNIVFTSRCQHNIICGVGGMSEATKLSCDKQIRAMQSRWEHNKT